MIKEKTEDRVKTAKPENREIKIKSMQLINIWCDNNNTYVRKVTMEPTKLSFNENHRHKWTENPWLFIRIIDGISKTPNKINWPVSATIT